jgi:antitoxin Phd
MRWSIRNAESQFRALVAAALKGRPQTVTKYGRPVVFILSVKGYQRLLQRQPTDRRSFVEHLLSIPKDEGTFNPAAARLRAVTV